MTEPLLRTSLASTWTLPVRLRKTLPLAIVTTPVATMPSDPVLSSVPVRFTSPP
ncbi:hypothetical protein [Sphaerotilus mobilis]|uniref:Uncharacterized protein n=1 Tax=Sphaerotilus mobilis TaxID=47994 RepID=A0A4V2EV40_9BURK|nr:hypothetical protein [Sphaerotilus mobilis]RZS47373.1 hypothetical protein EV685_3576 [Sphaerotilus mobilis]